jgi:hypothetical protein
VKYFKYELCSFPLSLFDSNCNLRNSNKSELAKEIAIQANYDPVAEGLTKTGNEEFTFVIDGGWLLHQLGWAKNERYSQIMTNYCDYVTTHSISSFKINYPRLFFQKKKSTSLHKIEDKRPILNQKWMSLRIT